MQFTISRQHLWMARLTIGLILACALPPLPAADPISPDSATLDAVSEGYEKYFELVKLISKEKGDWQLEREILKDRTQMVLDQIAELTSKTKEEESKITEADTEREKLQAQLDDLLAVEKTQFETIRRIEAQVKKMLPMLPAPLAQKIAPLASRLPKDDLKQEDIKLSISQRFGNVLGILNEINKFHSDIALVNERRDLGDGRQAEVETMYLGLSQGFYAGSGETANEAGVGWPTPNGFQWEKTPEQAESIARMIRIYKNAEVAEFVPIEVSLRKPR